MSKPFEPVIYDLDLIHRAAYGQLIPNIFLGCTDGISASMQLTQDNCVLLECFQRLLIPIDIMTQLLQERGDYWNSARIEVAPIPSNDEFQRSIGVAMMPYVFPPGHFIRVCALQTTPSLIIQATNFERRVIATVGNQQNIMQIFSNALRYPFIKEVIQE